MEPHNQAPDHLRDETASAAPSSPTREQRYQREQTKSKTPSPPRIPSPTAASSEQGAAGATGDFFIEPDTGPESSDNDSAFGSAPSDAGSAASTSIASSIYNYKYENGRRYHAYREGAYVLPNDETEQDRLDLLHHIWRLALGGRLFRAPIEDQLKRGGGRVLDFGTGTGIWAMDCGDEFPNAIVTGTDLSPIQPTWVPPNVKFYVDDCESPWTYPSSEAFDFIHGRAMAGSIKDWKQLYKDIYNNLKPGGWIEMQEYEAFVSTDDDSANRAPNLYKFTELIGQASVQFGKDINEAQKQKQNLIDAGFVNVRDDVYKIPVGPWPRDPKLKEIGRYELVQLIQAIEPFCFGYLGKVLQCSEAECRIFTSFIVKEIKNRNNHFYINFHYVYGQRPETDIFQT